MEWGELGEGWEEEGSLQKATPSPFSRATTIAEAYSELCPASRELGKVRPLRI